jgi:hypothetical protein
LSAPALTATIVLVDSPIVNKTTDAGQVQHTAAKWWTRWRHTSDASRADAHVARWKAAWLRGANAVWRQQPRATNPYESEMERAAWHAGAKWARENPDRRANRAPRFAHPKRRASDAKLPAVLKRAVAISATSLTLYAISKTLLRTNRAREAKH